MNNEPVAWINRKGKAGEHGYLEWDKDDLAEVNTPLYTHSSEHDLGIAEAIGFEKGHKSAEDMLRQQQAEIEALKAGKIRAYDNGVEDGRKPNTHPVKEQLTDEERLQFGMLFMNWNRSLKEPLVKPAYEQYVFEQAIAILLEAQKNG